MPFTSSDLVSVDAAIASGELRVNVNGRDITYRTVGELKEARSLIVAEIAQAAATSAGTGPRRGAYRVTFTTHRGD